MQQQRALQPRARTPRLSPRGSPAQAPMQEASSNGHGVNGQGGNGHGNNGHGNNGHGGGGVGSGGLGSGSGGNGHAGNGHGGVGLGGGNGAGGGGNGTGGGGNGGGGGGGGLFTMSGMYRSGGGSARDLCNPGRASPYGSPQPSPSCAPHGTGAQNSLGGFSVGPAMSGGAGLGGGGGGGGSSGLCGGSGSALAGGGLVSLGQMCSGAQTGLGMCVGGEALQSILEPETPGREDAFPDTPPRDPACRAPRSITAHAAASNSGAAGVVSARARPFGNADPGHAPASNTTGGAPVPLWQHALNHPALNGPKSGGAGGGSARPGSAGRGVCKRANSVASSINSLDSLVVD